MSGMGDKGRWKLTTLTQCLLVSEHFYGWESGLVDLN